MGSVLAFFVCLRLRRHDVVLVASAHTSCPMVDQQKDGTVGLNLCHELASAMGGGIYHLWDIPAATSDRTRQMGLFTPARMVSRYDVTAS